MYDRAQMAYKLLVVDDTPDTLEALAVFLRRSNYAVLTASSFEQARKVADQDTPDLIIVDVRLGEYNGLHLVIRERLAHPERPIIAISGYADEQTADEVRRYGAEFMAKPLQPVELAAAIARLLGGSRPAS